MPQYRCLNIQEFESDSYRLVPIRYEDRLKIMRWRNEQVYHLRQKEPLTEEDQEIYFNTVVASLFDQEKPAQVLFSLLKDGELIGYGGLVHIDWLNKNAEVSGLFASDLKEDNFSKNWHTLLRLLSNIAFSVLDLNKLYTYAFDLRPNIYPIFEDAGFHYEATLKKHVRFNTKFIDVVIHSKIKGIENE